MNKLYIIESNDIVDLLVTKSIDEDNEDNVFYVINGGYNLYINKNKTMVLGYKGKKFKFVKLVYLGKYEVYKEEEKCSQWYNKIIEAYKENKCLK